MGETMRSIADNPYLNIGGGNFIHECWMNLDYPFPAQERKRDFSLIDIPHNLMECKPIPVPDGCFEGVYTEHCIEHLPVRQVEYLFGEVHRILKAGGVFRVSCPDAEKVWASYKRGEWESWPKSWKHGNAEDSMLDVVATPLRGQEPARTIVRQDDMVGALGDLEGILSVTMEDQAARPGGHLSAWTAEKLVGLMSDAGLANAAPSIPRGSKLKAFRAAYIDKTQHKWSVYVEGTKDA